MPADGVMQQDAITISVRLGAQEYDALVALGHLDGATSEGMVRRLIREAARAKQLKRGPFRDEASAIVEPGHGGNKS